jgi:hypothetical protein
MKSDKPDPDTVLLYHALDKIGVEIRHGNFDMPEGLARIGDRYILFLRSGITPDREKELCIEAVKRMGPMALHVPPRVRELLGEDDWDNRKGAE